MTIRDTIARLGQALPAGRVTVDPDLIAPWTTDWRGKYHGTAAALVSPRSAAEVATILRIASDAGVPVVPQGGNSSMVGGATPPASGDAIILSLRAMNAIRSLDPAAGLAVCEAGVVLQHLHQAADEAGCRFPLSLGAKGIATIGGLISTNAGGTQVLRHGTMRNQVEGLEVVLPDGSVIDGLSALKKDNRGIDLKQLFIGAEGTLGVVTAATLRLLPAVAGRTVAWAGVASPHDALTLLRHVERALGSAVEGFELLSGDMLDVVIEGIEGTRRPIAVGPAWHVLIEAVTSEIDGVDDLRRDVEGALAAAMETGLVQDATIAVSETQAEAFWHIRENVSLAEKGRGPLLPFDISVPVAGMPDFMLAASAACEARFPGTSADGYGHLGDGNIHFHLRPPRDHDRGSAWIAHHGAEASRFVNDMVVAAGGSISAEHGIGQMKVDELARIDPPARIAAMRAVKAALDPAMIMNPGKLVPLATPPVSE